MTSDPYGSNPGVCAAADCWCTVNNPHTSAARETRPAPRAAEKTSAATSPPCGGGGPESDGGAAADGQDLPATSGEGAAPPSGRPWDKRRQMWGPWEPVMWCTSVIADALNEHGNCQVASDIEYGVRVYYIRNVMP